MVKLAPAERALASTVIPAGAAANVRRQQTQHTIVLYSWTVLPKTTCEMLQQKMKCLYCIQLSQAIEGRRKRAWTRFIAFSQMEFIHKSADARQVHSHILYSGFSYSFVSFHPSRDTYSLINGPAVNTFWKTQPVLLLPPPSRRCWRRSNYYSIAALCSQSRKYSAP